jgi:hypothetical protein
MAGLGWSQDLEGKIMGKETITQGKYHKGKQ